MLSDNGYPINSNQRRWDQTHWMDLLTQTREPPVYPVPQSCSLYLLLSPCPQFTITHWQVKAG